MEVASTFGVTSTLVYYYFFSRGGVPWAVAVWFLKTSTTSEDLIGSSLSYEKVYLTPLRLSLLFLRIWLSLICLDS